MTSPILALRAAILAAAQGDAELAGLMGGAVRFYEEPPRAAEPVYAVFGDVRARDWSTGSDRGHEQDLSITVWAKEGSARSALVVAERLSAVLDGAALILDGHRLVHLRVGEIDARRDNHVNLARAGLRLRAVTEVTT
jgi:Protein of unknown function (DUF3168)